MHFFLHYGDLTDSTNLTQLISQIRPDEIYNLGAMSHVKVRRGSLGRVSGRGSVSFVLPCQVGGPGWSGLTCVRWPRRAVLSGTVVGGFGWFGSVCMWSCVHACSWLVVVSPCIDGAPHLTTTKQSPPHQQQQ